MPGFPLQQANRARGGGVPVSTPLVFGSGWNVIEAPSDVARLNTIVSTLDPVLFFNVAAGNAYTFQTEAYFEANGAQDVRVTLGGSCTLTRLVAMNIRTDNTNTLNVTGPVLYTPAPFTAFPADIALNLTLGAFAGPFTIKGTIIPATSGTFGLAWAQQVASLVNPTTRIRGSYLQWKLAL
jgi:hypothetical protein